MNALELINFGSSKLKNHNIKSYKLDSELLLSKLLRKRREEVLTNLEQNISNTIINKYKKLVLRRSLKEPIAYILESKEFWSKDFEVSKDALIPRPETELMVEKLTEIYKNKNINILDIGTGSGCILISLLSELKNSKGLGIDISKKAISLAKQNAHKFEIKNDIKFLNISLEYYMPQKFDLIVSNPPFIKSGDLKSLEDDVKKFEPIIALDGGNDGLDVIKKVIYKAGDILKTNGLLALEIGNGQFEKVSKLLKKKSFKIEHIIKDYKENIRCIISKLHT